MSAAAPRSMPQIGRSVLLLRASLIAGALYDVVFAVIMLTAPELPARLLQLPLPGPSFYLHLIAVLLTMLAAVYLMAAYDPIAYRGIVRVAIVGRFAGGVVLGLAAYRGQPALAGLWVVAIADFAFAFTHALFFAPLRRRLPAI
ncbi:MAG: hypothetical protein AAF772_01265 [Acidobacteriota bacterium]